MSLGKAVNVVVSQEKSVENAFQVKEDSPMKERYDYGGRGRGRGKGGFSGRGSGRTRGHGKFPEQKQFNEHKSFTLRNPIQCQICKKPRHKECIDGRQVQIEGKGLVAINTITGKKKVLLDVIFVPKFAHNLLSIGQLMSSGLVIVFDDGYCYSQDKRYGQRIAKVRMTTNIMFPLDVSSVKEKAMVVKAWKDYDIWNLRYVHLHLNGLKLSKNKDMVMGLPNIEDIEFCEDCVLGKQRRNSFPVGKSWRASRHLELVRADLCGPMNTESLNGSRYFFSIN
nr:retrovirus-related Pol polyprotein from transposon TNT 1-94 [Tanacetum cinerariifolium]